MSKYNTMTVVGSAGNSVKAAFFAVEHTLDLYNRGVTMLHKECDIIEERQAIRLEEVKYELAEQATLNAGKRKKLTASA